MRRGTSMERIFFPAALALAFLIPVQSDAAISVDTETDLRAAVIGGEGEIRLVRNIDMTGNLMPGTPVPFTIVPVQTSMRIDGRGNTLSGGANALFYFAHAGTALNGGEKFILENITIDGAQSTTSLQNYTGSGPAVYFNAAPPGISSNAELVIGNGVRFLNGRAAGDGGSIRTLGGTVFLGENVVFEGNTSLQNAGALYNESHLSVGNSAFFSENTSGANGGGLVIADDESMGFAAVFGKNAKFIRNMAAQDGGGIQIRGGSLEFGSGAVFEANAAGGNGGAVILSDYSAAPDNIPVGTLSLAKAVFRDNTATADGGAIYNNGIVTFRDGVIFDNNFAGSVKNDIHNAGTLDFLGGIVVLDGGITGTGAVNFSNGTSLKAPLLTSASSSPIITAGTLTGDINLIIALGTTSGEIKFSAADMTAFSILANPLYTLTESGGLYSVSRKTNDEAAEALGLSSAQSGILKAIADGTSASPAFDALADRILGLLQSSDEAERQLGKKGLKALRGSEMPSAHAAALQTQGQVQNAVSSRLSGPTGGGMSAGEIPFDRAAVWGEGLYSKAILNGDGGFDSDSYGFAAGVEAKTEGKGKVGLGYAYTYTKISPDFSETKVDSHTPFVYGEYRRRNFFVDGMASWTFGRYKEDDNIAGTHVTSSYDVNALGLQVLAGYDFHLSPAWITPLGGLRYAHTKRDSAVDSAGITSGGDTADLLTGLAGIKFEKRLFARKKDGRAGMLLAPHLAVLLTYDIHQASEGAVITFANGATIDVKSENLKRFGGEIYGGWKTSSGAFDISLDYIGKFREYYQEHSGLLTVKYNF